MNQFTAKEKSAITSDLQKIVGKQYATDLDFVLAAYNRGASLFRGERQGFVVKPGSTEDVVAVVKFANKTGIPIVPRGGGTFLAGFSPGQPGKGIIVDMTRMNKILYVDKENLTAGAESGIILSELSSHIRRHGMHVHTVDVPKHIATLGGVISGYNGGGAPSDLSVVGELYHFLLGQEVVLPSGEVITTGSGPGVNENQERVIDRTTGTPDMAGMFIGDGGIFGIKTKIYFKIYPRPKVYIWGDYSFKSFEKMYETFTELQSMEPFPYSRLVAILIMAETDWKIFFALSGSTKEEVEISRNKLDRVCRANGGVKRLPEEALKTISSFSSRNLGKSIASKGMYFTFQHVFQKTEALQYFSKQKKFIKNELGKTGLDKHVVDWVQYLVPKQHHMIEVAQWFYIPEDILSSEDKENLKNLQIEEAKEVLNNKGFLLANQGVFSKLSSQVWSPEYRRFVAVIKKAMDPNNIMNPGLWGLN